MALNVEGPSTPGGIARGINLLLGFWLLISAFVWGHTVPERANSWIVGALVIAIALVASSVPAARWINTALSAWLFVSVWALPHHSVATRWNNALVAIAVFAISLVPGADQRHTEGAPSSGAAPSRTPA